MSDTLPDHEALERWVHDQPLDVIRKLPDNIARRRAETLIDQAYEYAKESRERKADRT